MQRSSDLQTGSTWASDEEEFGHSVVFSLGLTASRSRSGFLMCSVLSTLEAVQKSTDSTCVKNVAKVWHSDSDSDMSQLLCSGAVYSFCR